MIVLDGGRGWCVSGRVIVVLSFEYIDIIKNFEGYEQLCKKALEGESFAVSDVDFSGIKKLTGGLFSYSFLIQLYQFFYLDDFDGLQREAPISESVGMTIGIMVVLQIVLIAGLAVFILEESGKENTSDSDRQKLRAYTAFAVVGLIVWIRNILILLPLVE